jgi:prepilin signal peptidase PulO-like enzyme (type II secretory pathway)
MVFDAKYMILPDFSTTALFFLSIATLFANGKISEFVWYLLAAVGSFCFIGFLYWITKGKGMGFGDVKFAGFMGLFLGIQSVVLAMYVAFIGGALFGLGLMIFGRAGRKTKMAFGPFLILGTIVAWWYAKLR